MGVFNRRAKDGTPIYYVEFEYKGQKVKQSAGRGASHKQAQELETELRKQLQSETHARRVGKSLKKTFTDVLIEWLEGATGKIPDDKLKSHIRAARPYIENRPLEEGEECATKMIKAMTQAGRKPATINRRLQVIRQCLYLAYEWKWITWSPDRKIPELEENNKREIYLTPEQVKGLMSKCKAIHTDAPRAILLDVVTGLRCGELLKLGPENVTPDKSAIILTTKTKGKRPRRIPIQEMYRHLLEPLPLKLTPKQLRTSWVTARKALGLDRVWFHDLRHTFASWLANSGAHLQDIQVLLGHADIQTTMRYVALVQGRHDHVVAMLPSISAANDEGGKNNAA